jgi:hypothetical protein
MKRSNSFDFSITVFTLSVISILAVLPEYLYAYIDPGSGSYFVQISIAAILACLYSIKLYWRKIKSFFLKLNSKKE